MTHTVKVITVKLKFLHHTKVTVHPFLRFLLLSVYRSWRAFLHAHREFLEWKDALAKHRGAGIGGNIEALEGVVLLCVILSMLHPFRQQSLLTDYIGLECPC
jgi:hypothetical protein